MERFSALWRNRFASAAAFLVLAFLGGWAIHASSEQATDRLYTSQIKACERGNDLRMEFSDRVVANNAVRDTLRAFLVAARDARSAAGTATDLKAAREYERQIETLDKQARFVGVAQVDCFKAIQRP